MVRLLNFSDHHMTRSQMLCTESAFKYGAGQVFQYGPEHIGKEFLEFNKEILSAERGAGYWLWKPYLIWRSLEFCKPDDILVYCDSGVEIITDLNEVVKEMDQDIFLFTSGHLQREWCKADIMEATVTEKAMASPFEQVQASVIFFKITDFSLRFIKEWLLWCQMPGMIDDSPSVINNHETFREHRHDQAILTCMAIKYGLTLHWWADKKWFENQRHRWPKDNYPSMFLHHRKRNNEY